MFDERFKLHRYKSTSLAAVVGGVALGALALFELYETGRVPRALLGVLTLMALTKLAALLWFRLRD